MSIGARNPVLPVIAVCCVLVGWFAWSAVPAFAVAPETPEVSVEALVPPTTAVVHGVLNPGVEGAPGTYELGTYEFLYKQGKAGCEGESKAPASPGLSLGAGKEAVSETLSGLSPDTEYTLCLLVRNGIKGEQAISGPVTFKTSASLEAPVLRELASGVTATTATFEGELNPGGATGRLSYQLDYNTNGTCAGGESTAPVEVTEAKQFQVSPVEVTELEPNDTYTFCLVVTNVLGEQAQGNEVLVLTGHQVPAIIGVSVANTTSTSATVSGGIYPHGEVATYRVEYGLNNAYGSSTPEASISAQHGPASIQAQLTGLAPNSEYHYRIIATNSTGSEQSPDATFMTSEMTVAGSQGLPDDRAFEMVTPPNNDDANVYVPFALGVAEPVSEGVQTSKLFQVASDGSAVIYEGDATSGGGNGIAGSGIGNQFLARRLAGGGWVNKSIQPPGTFSTLYLGFASDLSAGVLTAGTEAEPEDPPLSEEALGGGSRVLYKRSASENSYQPLYTNAVQPERPEVGVNRFGTNKATQSTEAPIFAGGSADFSSLLFEVNDALLAGDGAIESELRQDVGVEIAKEENKNYLYDSVDGRLTLVDVSPEGKVVPDATFGGPAYSRLDEHQPDFSGTISADGSRVYWSSLKTTNEQNVEEVQAPPTGLYLRENPTEPQSPVVNGRCSVASDACTIRVSAGEARYWASAADGRYAFYSEGGGLYRFDAEPEAGHGSRETVAEPSAGVMAALGVSEDGEDVYFVATGILSGASSEGAEPVEGEPNLYLSHDGGTPVFIATLSYADGSGIEPLCQTS